MESKIDKKAILMYGGSFNPPANTHFRIAQSILNTFPNIEKIIFMPVGINYPKPCLIDPEKRYEMLKLVCEHNEKFTVSRMEIDSEHLIKTIDSLEMLEEIYPSKEIWFFKGADGLEEIVFWKEWQKLLSNFNIIIGERNGLKENEIKRNFLFLHPYLNKIHFLEEVPINISSSIIRKLIKNKIDIRYLVPDEIYYYIKENHLYLEGENEHSE